MSEYISIESILGHYEEKDKYMKKNKIDFEDRTEKTYLLERKLAIQYQQDQFEECKNDEFLKVLKGASSFIDYKKFSELIRTQFYNTRIMEILTCLLFTQFLNPQNFKPLTEQVKIWEGENEKEDLVIFFSNLFQGNQKIFAFKYEGNFTLHEAFVGLFCGNEMRNILPTFVWTYGYTNCNLPYIASGKLVQGCVRPVNYGLDANSKTEYVGLITEFVEGPSLYDYLEQDITVNQFKSMILTVLYSLKYANDKFHFVHWDLHYSNVIMRKLEQDNYYLYLPNENKYLWVGNYLATIIDYGSASFEYQDKLISNYFRYDLGIRPDLTSSPLNDIMKLFSSIYSKIENQPKLLKVFQRIFTSLTGILSSDYTNKFLKIYEDNFDIYPNFENALIEDQLIEDIDGLIQYVENQSLDLMKETKPENVLSCLKSKCLGSNELYQQVVNREEIYTITEFVEAIDKNIDDRWKKSFLNKIKVMYGNRIKELSEAQKKTNAQSVIIFDELYHLTKNLENVLSSFSKFGAQDVKVLKQIYKQAMELLQIYQSQALAFLKKKTKSIQPLDQISVLGKDLNPKSK
jgi:hypothetical protein